MRWLSALRDFTRNGIESPDLPAFDDVRRLLAPGPGHLGTVPIAGHGGLTGQELAAAGASLAVAPEMATIEDLHHARERLEAFIERAATDVSSRNLRGAYWDLQSTDIDATQEVEALAGEMDHLGHVEGAAVVGWVIRNAAIRAQRPIVSLARTAEEVSGDALGMAETLLDSAQRLDPTYGGYTFSLRPRRGRGRRFRERFGRLWVYGD
jgi:hypothetical protein